MKIDLERKTASLRGTSRCGFGGGCEIEPGLDATTGLSRKVARLREAGERRLRPENVRIAVGMGTCGRAAGASEVFDALCDGVLERGMDARVVRVGCRGLCWAEPLVEVQLPGRGIAVYGPVRFEHVGRMLDRFAVGELYDKDILLVLDRDERPLLGDALSLGEGFSGHSAALHAKLSAASLWSVQKRRVMSKLGRIAPASIDEYAALGGYAALVQVVESMTPDEVLRVIEESGLRGRGGAGFPTGRKWRLTAESDFSAGIKYIIANADEGDPGAFMDRGLLEGDPHAVIEGMMIAGYAMGARKGYIYTRSEYPHAAETLQRAIEQARGAGILGVPLGVCGFSFDLEVIRSGGAYVCGEGTALVRALEGYPGRPRKRPPHLTERGLWGCPTCMNNVETLANVPLVVARGATWYRTCGTEESAGTKIFSIAGDAAYPGLVEVPFGMPVSSLLDALGVGAYDAHECLAKALQIGGPSGVILPVAQEFSLDFESLDAYGGSIGSGGIVVLGMRSCVVDTVKFLTAFCLKESCGQCKACRDGLGHAVEILERFCEGEASEDDLCALADVAQALEEGSLCGLGRMAARPIQSSLRFFKGEYAAHMQGSCPGLTCKKLIRFCVNAKKCIGCRCCKPTCPTNAMKGRYGKPSNVIERLCIRCWMCASTCPYGAVDVKTGA